MIQPSSPSPEIHSYSQQRSQQTRVTPLTQQCVFILYRIQPICLAWQVRPCTSDSFIPLQGSLFILRFCPPATLNCLSYCAYHAIPCLLCPHVLSPGVESPSLTHLSFFFCPLQTYSTVLPSIPHSSNLCDHLPPSSPLPHHGRDCPPLICRACSSHNMVHCYSSSLCIITICTSVLLLH